MARAAALDVLAVDARGASRDDAPLLDLLAAVVVDVEDVETVDQARDETKDRQEYVDNKICARRVSSSVPLLLPFRG